MTTNDTLLFYHPDRRINQRRSASRMAERVSRSGLRQNEIAKRMKIASGFLCDLLQGNRNWSEHLAWRLDTALAQPKE